MKKLLIAVGLLIGSTTFANAIGINTCIAIRQLHMKIMADRQAGTPLEKALQGNTATKEKDRSFINDAIIYAFSIPVFDTMEEKRQAVAAFGDAAQRGCLRALSDIKARKPKRQSSSGI